MNLVSPRQELARIFEERVQKLPASPKTRAYIQGLFIDQTLPARNVDFSKESMVLAHMEAGISLIERQSLGDWSLWVLSWFPKSVERYRDVVETLGRLNYLRCYRLVPSWTVYEELADQLPTFVRLLYRPSHVLR